MGRDRIDPDFVTEVVRVAHRSNFWKFFLVFILISTTAIGLYLAFLSLSDGAAGESAYVGSENSFLASLADAVSETFGDGVAGGDEQLVEIVDVHNSGGNVGASSSGTESAEVVLVGGESHETQSSPGSEKKANGVKEKVINYCSFSTSGGAGYDVLINEVAWMGSGSSANDEWIELKNVSGQSVDLDGWQIVDKAEQIQVLLGGNLPADGFYLLERTNDDSAPGVSADVIYSGALSNNDEGLRLFDNNCDLVDEVFADPNWPAGDAPARRTMQRENSLNWSTAASATPKAENGEAFANDPEEEPEEDSPPPPAPSEVEGPPPPPEPESPGKININTANFEELKGITGVGPVIAQRIIDYRNTNGPFEKIEDIVDVSGIGPVKFEKMKDQITVDGT